MSNTLHSDARMILAKAKVRAQGMPFPEQLSDHLESKKT